MMGNYVKLYEYAKYMKIERGDIILISSDSKKMAFDALTNKEPVNLNNFIDGIIDVIGPEGTLLFPTYNWDFCGGETFDYKNTTCKTGTLGTIALKRSDFKRTKHPIYSFAVYGNYQDELCNMENTDSFGIDSPFNFFKKKNAKNYIIDVSLQHSFTFAHFVEEQSGVVKHRYVKDFHGDYVDERGNVSRKTYSMFVRNLDLDVKTTINPIEDDFIKAGCLERFTINSSSITLVMLGSAYDVLLNDIINNNSRKICEFKGQN